MGASLYILPILHSGRFRTIKMTIKEQVSQVFPDARVEQDPIYGYYVMADGMVAVSDYHQTEESAWEEAWTLTQAYVASRLRV